MRWRSTSGSEWWGEVPSGEPGIWGRILVGERETQSQLCTRIRCLLSPAPRRERTLGKPRPDFRSSLSWETPPLRRSRLQPAFCAPAEFCSLMPDSFIQQILSANSTGLALGAQYTVKTKIGVAFSLEAYGL